MTKALMIQQGYVPGTCALPDPPGGTLIWSAVLSGTDVCAGCTWDRSICHGRPYIKEAEWKDVSS